MNSNSIQGILATFGAYFLWGLLPVYWKGLSKIPADEIIAHRIIWSFLCVLLVMWLRGTISKTRQMFYTRSAFIGVILCSLCITANWTMYVWAVNSAHILDTSMGYYIGPIVSVLFGALILKERLGWEGIVALSLASLGVGFMLVRAGQFPWIAVFLALTFALYGLFKKTMPVGVEAGLFWETAVMTPVAVLYLVFLHIFSNRGVSLNEPTPTIALLSLIGIVTTVPLILFGIGTRRADLSVIGFIQYVSPTITLLLGLFIYGEEMGQEKLMAFILIWAGLLVFTLARITKKRETAIAEP